MFILPGHSLSNRLFIWKRDTGGVGKDIADPKLPNQVHQGQLQRRFTTSCPKASLRTPTLSIVRKDKKKSKAYTPRPAIYAQELLSRHRSFKPPPVHNILTKRTHARSTADLLISTLAMYPQRNETTTALPRSNGREKNLLIRPRQGANTSRRGII